MQNPSLRSTRWLAHRLGLSITTIERLRASRSPDLPPLIVIGKSIRYDEAAVELWLTERSSASSTSVIQQRRGERHVAS
ncbi:MAG: helix-turn-helix domain-containing protein [Rhodocyclaceae bacterium]